MSSRNVSASEILCLRKTLVLKTVCCQTRPDLLSHLLKVYSRNLQKSDSWSRQVLKLHSSEKQQSELQKVIFSCASISSTYPGQSVGW